ncbi:hypothetical protein HJG60_008420 [Phyllostomus discolor]|uniref:Uncharacterized protein n=1 Tax=Phyllostomus discolor TaxID=89673 RepID=A0A833Z744_9CHIR|nr:hypothetical protein HJG60_008420 [Phyllostomus discolor]
MLLRLRHELAPSPSPASLLIRGAGTIVLSLGRPGAARRRGGVWRLSGARVGQSTSLRPPRPSSQPRSWSSPAPPASLTHSALCPRSRVCTGRALGLTPAAPPRWTADLSDAQAAAPASSAPYRWVGEATGDSVRPTKAVGATRFGLPTVKAREMPTKMIKALKTKECKKAYNTL